MKLAPKEWLLKSGASASALMGAIALIVVQSLEEIKAPELRVAMGLATLVVAYFLGRNQARNGGSKPENRN